jgi:four helix bundle protein
MPTINKFEELEIWQLARELSKKIFEETKKGKLSKDFKLKDQMNGATGSMMDNIAEGFGRKSRLEFVQFLAISNGSGNELQSQLHRCFDREYFIKETFDDLYEHADKTCRKISTLIKYLNENPIKGQKFKDRTI